MRRLAHRIRVAHDAPAEQAELARAWWQEFDNTTELMTPGVSGFVYSEERIAAPLIGPKTPRVGRGISMHPAAAFLRAILDSSTRNLDVRVVVVLRNQATMLASHYAQTSKNLPFAGQRSFERHVRRVLKRPGYLGCMSLDWDRMVSDLSTVVGPDRVQALLFEELDSDRFWADLASVLQIGPIDRELRLAPQPGQENRRSTRDRNGWELSALRPGKEVSIAMRKHRVRFARRVVRRALCELERYVVRRHRGEIVLSDRLRNEVAATYRSSNERLGERLGRDLGALGY